MRKSFVLIFFVVLFCSHDLFVKMQSYFIAPNSEVTLDLYNGTFEKSENTIDRARMQDASLVRNGKRYAFDPEQWSDIDSTITQLSFKTEAEGTYVVGVATLPRNIALSAEKFNDYLAHDGVVDMLESRKKNSTITNDAVEQYEKHVKAIIQVGNTRSNDWNTKLKYPIEFVPLSNPYEKNSGDRIEIQLLLEGQPLSDQLVIAQHKSSDEGHSHNSNNDEGISHTHNAEGTTQSHTHEAVSSEGHTHTEGQQLRTNAEGIVTVDLPKDGLYFLKTIYMITSENDELTHESKWATLAFEVTHDHNASTHTHHDDHDEGIPSYLFWLGSIVVVGILFFFIRKKDAKSLD